MMFKTAALILAAVAVATGNPAKKVAPLGAIIPYTACGASFTDETGEVSSPNYPNNYPNNVYPCSYTITVPEGNAILLAFDVIATEENYDFVDVYDGPSTSSPLLASFSGSYPPRTLTSTGNTILIRFESDFSNSDTGFHATWSAVCGRLLTTATGTYSSPNYPADYDNNLDECYGIQVAAGQAVKLTFEAFTTEEGVDFLDVYDGSSDAATEIASLSGEQSGTVIVSSSNALFMKFNTSAEVAAPGFLLNYKSVCANRQSGDAGTVTSPNYPEAYPNNADVCYGIGVAAGSVVQLTFSRLLTEPDNDNVAVYDGDDFTAPLLGRFSGNADGAVVTSTTNSLTLRFTSDASTYGLGFSADFVAVPAKH